MREDLTLQSTRTDLVVIDTRDDQAAAETFFRPYPAALVAYDRTGESRTILGQLPTELPLTVLIDQNQLVAAVYPATISNPALTAAVQRLAR